MWIVAIAWLYVALMMAMAEATSSQGTVLGAVITFLFYGAGPVALVMYVLSTPARRKALRQREAEEHARQAQAAQAEGAGNPESAADPAAPPPGGNSPDADGRSLPPGDAVPPERKEP